MKFLVILPLFVAASIALPYVPYVPPGWANLDTYDEFLEQVKEAYAGTGSKTSDRIAVGVDAKKGDLPEFCWLNIGFYQKQQICGCFVYDKQHVVTSARCVKDCSESMATNITVNFPQLSGKDAMSKTQKIWVPTSDNVDGTLSEYTGDGAGTHHVITGNNLAVIRLENEIPKFAESKDIRAAKIDEKSADAAAVVDTNHKASEGWKFKACGVGVINNKGERAKGITCTDVNIITDSKKCIDSFPSPAARADLAYTVPTGQFCIQWPDRDNNICVGDFGGPVIAYKPLPPGTDPTKIDVANQEVVCVLVGSPNVRANAQCLDGHITFCQQFTGMKSAYKVAMSGPSWVNTIVNPTPAPAGRKSIE